MAPGETSVAVICIVIGVVLHYRSRRTKATDMVILGIMLWLVGIVAMLDAHFHFLTDPEH